MARNLFRIFLGFFVFATLSCSVSDSQFYQGALGIQNPKIVIASNQVGSTALVMYDINGNFIRVLNDYSSDIDTPRGLVPLSPTDFLISIDGNDRLERFNLITGEREFVTHASFTGNIFQARRHPQYGTFVIETNTIEAFDDNGVRSGNPRIPATVGACAMSANGARGMAINQAGNLIVTDITTDDIYVYDVSDELNTTCVRSNTTFGNIDPIAVLAHSDGFLYVATQGDDRIYRFAGDGSGAATVIWATNLTLINNPTALAEMPDGSILVASDGTNSIVRIRTDGSFVGLTNFIFDVYTNSISDIMILTEDSP